MNTHSLVWGGMIVGSTLGGFLASLWGGSAFAPIIWSGIGGIVGIYFGFKLGNLAE